METKQPVNPALLARIKDLETRITELEAQVDDYQRRAAYFQMLHETGTGLLSLDSVDSVMSYVLQQAIRLADTEHGFVHVIQDDEIHLHDAASTGLFVNAPVARPSANEGFVGEVIRQEQTLLVADYDTWEGRRAKWPYGITRATLGVPMKADNKLIGVLGVAYSEPERQFTLEIVQAIEAIAELASPALEKARLNRELTESRYFTERITETVPGIIYVFDMQTGQSVYVNSAVRHLLGYDEQTILEGGATFLQDLIHPEDIALIVAHSMQLHEAGEQTSLTVEYRMRHASGEWRWFRSRDRMFRMDEDGRPLQSVGVVQDIHDRKQAEVALQASEEQFRTLFEHAPIGIALISEDGGVITTNPAMERFLGYTADELKAIRFEDYTVPDDFARENELIQQLRAGEIDHYELEKRYIHRDGRILWGSISATLFEIDGQVMGVAMIENITERRQNAARQREIEIERERMRVLAGFIRDVSHDFRTPLSTMYTSLYMLRRIWDNEDRRNHHLDILQSQVGHIEGLVEGLFTMARLDATDNLERRPLDINEMLRELASKISSRRENGFDNIECTLDPGQPYILANGAELHRALLNIIENAILFTQPQGQITLATRLDGDRVEISVRDTGAGITPEDLPHVFERFYRGDKARTLSGLGLGLSIVQKVVEKHHGEITIESAVGDGTTVRLRIPVAYMERKAGS